MFLDVAGWWQVGSGKDRVHVEPLTSSFHQLAQGLVGRIAPTMFVCRDHRLGCARSLRQLCLGQPLSASNGLNDRRSIHEPYYIGSSISIGRRRRL